LAAQVRLARPVGTMLRALSLPRRPTVVLMLVVSFDKIGARRYASKHHLSLNKPIIVV
jgi:hypothetical protein